MSSTSTPAVPDGSTVTYEQLHEIQEEFEDAEVELGRCNIPGQTICFGSSGSTYANHQKPT